MSLKRDSSVAQTPPGTRIKNIPVFIMKTKKSPPPTRCTHHNYCPFTMFVVFTSFYVTRHLFFSFFLFLGKYHRFCCGTTRVSNETTTVIIIITTTIIITTIIT